MNILIVGGMFPPMRTGTSFYTRNIALALRARGHGVTVVTLDGAGAEDTDALDVRRLPALRLPLAGFFKHFRLCSIHPGNWSRLARIADEVKADVVLLVNHYLDIAFPAAWAARRRRVPVVCSVGTQLQSLNPARDRVLNFLDRLVCGRLVFRFCDRVVAWDTQIRKYLADVHGDAVTRKTAIVNYGVNGDSAQLASIPADYRPRGVILGVGAVSEQRSFVPLVRAFALLAGELPQLRLRIAGHVYYDEAVRLATELGLADRVDFLGELPHERVIAEMRGADVFYSSLTAKYVGLGTATIEAMLLGLPTVVNTPLDLLGTEVLVDGLHLVQCVDDRPDVISAKIKALLGDASLRRKVGEGGRNFVSRCLNWEVVARDMEVVLQEAVAGGAAA